MDEGAAIEYGADPNAAVLLNGLTAAIGKFGKQRLASHIGISRSSLTKILDAKCQSLSARLSQNIGSAIAVLNSKASEGEKLLELARMEVANIGLSEFSRRLPTNKANLKNILGGKRKAGRRFFEAFASYLGLRD